MRKKSHISLAKYIVEDMQFGETFDLVTEQIRRLSSREEEQSNLRAYMRHLGEVIHYVADYFTFPHNSTYDGNLKDHCYYEKALKFRLREYASGADRGSSFFYGGGRGEFYSECPQRISEQEAQCGGGLPLYCADLLPGSAGNFEIGRLPDRDETVCRLRNHLSFVEKRVS